jgi:shikimate dehydrogenase
MNIVLIGFMGSGKTSVAKILAGKLGREAVETDSLILKKSGRRSINEIFEQDGEKKFRALESQVAGELSGRDNIIISTGGGIVADKKSMERLKKNGKIFYLKDSFEKILKRLEKDKTRPLFRNLKKAKKLFSLRQPVYAKYADEIINCAANPDLKRISREIMSRLEKNLRKSCLIIGDPIRHSLSPAMHNAGYKALGIDNQYIFLPAEVKARELKNAVKAVKALDIRGVSCTMPHKQAIIKYIDRIDPAAKIIGAVNTVVNDGGKLTGYNTDWIGAIIPLEKVIGKTGGLKNKKAALLGTGGAARAIAFGLTKKGAKLKIFGRNIAKAKKLAKEFKVSFGSFLDIHELINFDIIINATPIGMKPDANKTPVPKEFLHEDQIVLDAVYAPGMTKLLKDAKIKGAKIISGIEMLLYQGAAQFELYTGKKAPVEAMKKAIIKQL